MQSLQSLAEGAIECKDRGRGPSTGEFVQTLVKPDSFPKDPRLADGIATSVVASVLKEVEDGISVDEREDFESD